ncbi:hypothetical protein Hanom_Chr01g00001741 [Helianthus anomalus]
MDHPSPHTSGETLKQPEITHNSEDLPNITRCKCKFFSRIRPYFIFKKSFI